jgi:Uma2 family endonuclease
MSEIVEPTRHKLTTDDFERLGESGFFAEDRRIELIEGDLIDMPPPGPGHMSVDIRLNRLLVLRAGDDALVSANGSLKLPPWSMPQPDFMLLRPRVDGYAEGVPGPGDVLLVVEVADSSRRHDLITKARVYAKHGVCEYWVFEVPTQRLYLHREAVAPDGLWRSVQVLEAPFRIAPLALPRLEIDADELWPPVSRGGPNR